MIIVVWVRFISVVFMIGVISWVLTSMLSVFRVITSIEWSMISTHWFMHVLGTTVSGDSFIYCWNQTKVGSINYIILLSFVIST